LGNFILFFERYLGTKKTLIDPPQILTYVLHNLPSFSTLQSTFAIQLSKTKAV